MMIVKTRNALLYMLKNPLYIIIHFGCWFLLASILTLPYQSNNYWQYLIEGIPFIWFMAFISSYREVRGKLRGIFKAHNVWTNWHNQQINNKDQPLNYDNPPILEYTQFQTLYFKVRSVLISLIREPIPLLVHFVVWSIAFGTGIYFDDPMQADILGGKPTHMLFDDIKSEYWESIPFILIVTLITCIQEVRGYISGINKKHQENTERLKRHLNETKVNELFDLPSYDTKTQQVSTSTASISRYLFLQLGLGILIYVLISVVLGAIGIVDNPNFFIQYLSIVLFIVI